jgi:hypothetical protein
MSEAAVAAVAAVATVTTVTTLPEVSLVKDVDVKQTVESLIAATEVVSTAPTSELKDVVVTAALAAPVVNEVKTVIEVVGAGVGLTDSTLTEAQQKLLETIYEKTKTVVASVLGDSNLNNSVKVTLLIGQIIKQLEGVKLDKVVLSGGDKKAVAIELGRRLIKELAPKEANEILPIYDLVADRTLEAMIDVSRVVNVVVQQVATQCCPGLLSLFKKFN